MNFLNPTLTARTKGVTITLLLSFTILLAFFSSLLSNPNEYYFASSGDGLQSYFQVLYHTKYDTTYLRQQSINYPWGESIFFTGGMPAITNTIKLLKPLVDLSDYTVGILNVLMLMSIPFSALFIFLLFDQMKIGWLYGAFVATGIAFFSPQLDRLGGHLALTFQFILPAYIYFLYAFYRQPSYIKSWLIGAYVFLIATQHLYFLGFTGLISFFFFFVLFIKKDEFVQEKITLFLHFLVQIFLPYLTIQLLLFYSESATDRTSFPWGFLVYKANLSSVFFPSRQWYENLTLTFIKPMEYEWEGRAYIGLTGLFTTLYLCFVLLKNILLKQKITLTGNVFLNILMLASLCSLLYSFGLPFLYFEEWLKYSGPIKQMRGIGRFAWIFFYVINIVGFYLLYKWTENTKPIVKIFTRLLSIALLFSEAYPTVKLIQPAISNKIPELQDSKNILPQNQWINKVRVSDFQALLPLPYFHIGSENINIGAHSDITLYSYILSLKTGLPLYAVSASRTSLSETYKNIALVSDNSTLPELPALIPQKPFLVLCKKAELNEEELLLYNKCILLFNNTHYEVLKLYPEAVSEIHHERKAKILNEMVSEHSIPTDTFLYTQLTFEDRPSAQSFRGAGALTFKANPYTVVYNATLPKADTSHTFNFSFWLYNFKKDLYPRTSIEIILTDSTSNAYHYEVTNPMWKYKQFNQEWALIEFPVSIRNKNDSLKVTFYHKDLRPENDIIIDQLMIKPSHLNVYKVDSLYISKNNRYYLK